MASPEDKKDENPPSAMSKEEPEEDSDLKALK